MSCFEVPVHVFCQFSIRLVVFFFMICTTSVYILKMTYLPDIHYEYYFPFCELSIFILLMVSLWSIEVLYFDREMHHFLHYDWQFESYLRNFYRL